MSLYTKNSEPISSDRLSDTGALIQHAQMDAGLRTHMLSIYNWMASGLMLTGIVAYLIANTAGLNQMLWTVTQGKGGAATAPTILGWAAILSPLAFLLVLSFGVHRLSKTAAQALFWVFSATMGASLSSIFLTYTDQSIAQTFLVVAITFAATSLYGYVTKTDLTRFGSFLIMGLIGIVVAGLVNLFLASSLLAFVVNAIGLVVFIGLTAYDTQRIKTEYLSVWSQNADGDATAKAGVLDALALYLNFVNLFQILLSFIGERKES
jgi:FtsH-binding integral membrane protein